MLQFLHAQGVLYFFECLLTPAPVVGARRPGLEFLPLVNVEVIRVMQYIAWTRTGVKPTHGRSAPNFGIAVFPSVSPPIL